WLEDAEDYIDRRCLPCPIRTEQPDDFVSRDLKGNTVNSIGCAVTFRQRVDGEYIRLHASILSSDKATPLQVRRGAVRAFFSERRDGSSSEPPRLRLSLEASQHSIDGAATPPDSGGELLDSIYSAVQKPGPRKEGTRLYNSLWTILPSTIVNTDRICLISTSGIVK